jgi:hypothetical protein
MVIPELSGLNGVHNQLIFSGPGGFRTRTGSQRGSFRKQGELGVNLKFMAMNFDVIDNK